MPFSHINKLKKYGKYPRYYLENNLSQCCLTNYDNNKIAVCMWYDKAIEVYADIAKKINKRYCDNRGYDFIFSNTRNLPNRHPSWECISLLLNVLKTGKYNYVMWIDADACFNFKSTNTIENIIKQNKDKDIIFSGDDPNYPHININMGVILLKNTKYSIDFCKKIINSHNIEKCVNYYNKPLWEQECVNYLYDKNNENIQKSSVIIPFKILQTFPIRYNKQVENAIIAHYAGEDKNTRILELNKILSDINN